MGGLRRRTPGSGGDAGPAVVTERHQPGEVPIGAGGDDTLLRVVEWTAQVEHLAVQAVG
ncbi:hypothetical protein [Streptomyces sviceus]|uniref:hypothetical protein n=1 Tax=Streptomyces sviceus TaxID=285530 RepID=UPI0036E8955B